MSARAAVSGAVFLVGAGPGDPGLITRRGAELLGSADTVVYDGLVNPVLLDLAPPGAERIYAGKKRAPGGAPLRQEEINRLLVKRALAGERVVRLKGGDPFVFGRGAEECRELLAAGVRFELVPGVTAATAVTAYAGIPLTARGVASTVAFATGHEAAGKPASDVDWEALARAGTVVLFMAWRTVADCCSRLLAAGRAPDTPAGAIYWGTTPSQQTVVSTLRDLPGAVQAAGLRPPVLVVVGEVVAMRGDLAWYETRPLFGARVLATRNAARSLSFVRAVAELGGQPVIMPVTRIAPPAESEDPAGDRARERAVAEIDRAIDEIGRYRWVLFSSANSVKRFFAELGARGLDTRALGNARVACVGPATARAAAERGIRPDVIPAHGDAKRLAEAVIAADSGPHEETGQVLLPRAARGRDEAVHALRAAGYEVSVLTVYRTEIVGADDPTIRHGLERLQGREIDAIAFFAPSQVRALFDILGPDAAAIVRACPIVAAIGNTTRAALTQRGVDVHVVPSSPDAEVLAHELAHYRIASQSRQRAEDQLSNQE